MRKDEALAAEEEQARLRKIAIAEKEARTELLRDKARASRPSRDAIEAGTSSSSLPISFTSGSIAESAPRTHINFFQESESGNAEEKANEERKKEEKEEQQKWERKVGISVALGQTPGGPLDNQLNPWWMQAKKGKEEEDEEEKDAKSKKVKGPEKKPVLSVQERFDAEKVKQDGRHKRDEKRKRQMDPMMEVAKQLSKHKKHKKEKHSYDDKVRSSIRKEKKEKKKKTIEELRAERLRREGKEKTKTLDFLGGKPTKKEKEERKEKDRDSDKSYFNSQFFPELARKRKQ